MGANRDNITKGIYLQQTLQKSLWCLGVFRKLEAEKSGLLIRCKCADILASGPLRRNSGEEVGLCERGGTEETSPRDQHLSLKEGRHFKDKGFQRMSEESWMCWLRPEIQLRGLMEMEMESGANHEVVVLETGGQVSVADVEGTIL